MKRGYKLFTGLALFALLLTGCNTGGGGSDNPPVVEDTYTITWKNWDGNVLEIDKNVKKGTLPTYDGATPTRPDDDEYTYTWNGWDPEVAPATVNQTYVATYTKMDIEEKLRRLGAIPTLSEDGKTITYGLYPQSNVNDSSLVSALNALITPESNGWYLYDGNYYAKVSATPCELDYVFDNGTTIERGTTYWFKCEPIVWNVLSNNDGEYFILSSVLLDVHGYYNLESTRIIDAQTVYPNNYKYSDIRAWLNNDFYNSAFALGNSHIQTTTIDNSAATTDSASNKYACSNTEDKVFLPSLQDYINSSYGFETNKNRASTTRYCRTTDWARAKGADLFYDYSDNTYTHNASYWSRSPLSHRSSHAWYVIGNGSFDYCEVYYHTSFCARPAISITIA